MLDNDYGEHWFDNWDEREAVEERAHALGLESDELMILKPERMANERDGPCHPPELRKLFWTDVLRSLELSYELLFEEARYTNAQNASLKEMDPSLYIEDLEDRYLAEARLEKRRPSLTSQQVRKQLGLEH